MLFLTSIAKGTFLDAFSGRPCAMPVEKVVKFAAFMPQAAGRNPTTDLFGFSGCKNWQKMNSHGWQLKVQKHWHNKTQTHTKPKALKIFKPAFLQFVCHALFERASKGVFGIARLAKGCQRLTPSVTSQMSQIHTRKWRLRATHPFKGCRVGVTKEFSHRTPDCRIACQVVQLVKSSFAFKPKIFKTVQENHRFTKSYGIGIAAGHGLAISGTSHDQGWASIQAILALQRASTISSLSFPEWSQLSQL